jgi:biotin carboxylase
VPRRTTRARNTAAGAHRKAGSKSRTQALPARATKPARPIAIYHEHPRWFLPVFAELDRRNIPYVRLDAARHHFDLAANGDQQYGLIFNRMSPSAWTRGNAHAIFYTLSYLAHLERSGVRVVNGSHAFRVETSKALQLSLLHSLGLPHPRSAVINHPSQAVAAARGLRFPIVVKPNIGGSGVGIVRFDSIEQLESAVRHDAIHLGLDSTGIVQEFIPARGGHITRVETLGYKYLYGIKVFTSGETFDLCPMDICKTTDGAEIKTACVVEGAKTGLRVAGYRPPPKVITAVERVFREAQIEVGGLEYIIDDRDGQLYYYDVNALSNFVSDGPRIVGFDPFARLVDYLVKEAR